MVVKVENIIDASTEQKIKAAALKLFTRNGFASTKTRDIAKEAGINMSMLNYYFRSKEKLFDIIVEDNSNKFMNGVVNLFNDKNTTLERKFELLVDNYINMLIKFPDIPIFFMSEMKRNPEKLADKMGAIKDTYFVKQYSEAVKAGMVVNVEPIHFLINICSLLMFPFAAAPMLKGVTKMSNEKFNELMEARKKLIPIWIKGMMMK